MAPNKEDAIIGCLLGMAVGDALGLPAEGMSKTRQLRMYPEIDRYHFLWGRGMVSDDTEHACMVAQALIVSGGNVTKFTQSLAGKLRWWLLGLPAGIGYATLRAICKLWLGFSPERSGVFSAGNGPAMRSPIIGVCYGHDRLLLRQLVSKSTRITHSDPQAEVGALAVAIAAHLASSQLAADLTPQSYYQTLQDFLGTEAEEFLALIATTIESVKAGESTAVFAAKIGCSRGVSGYIYRTVPVVLHAWWRHPLDYREAIAEVIRCGGDTDTTAAILGAIVGATVGKSGIPSQWLNHLWEWPRSILWIEQLGQRLAEVTDDGRARSRLKLSIYGLVLRNLLFTLVVLAHGFRRLLPPY
jgi:ADP-ribosylglycohydrolase